MWVKTELYHHVPHASIYLYCVYAPVIMKQKAHCSTLNVQSWVHSGSGSFIMTTGELSHTRAFVQKFVLPAPLTVNQAHHNWCVQWMRNGTDTVQCVYERPMGIGCCDLHCIRWVWVLIKTDHHVHGVKTDFEILASFLSVSKFAIWVHRHTSYIQWLVCHFSSPGSCNN